ncbi:MAG: FAD-binding oxidoreductase, partial [Proteobacteria bacterium]|nr:FAD-binding oxidoreductase [Pseudomonadota bacterium]
MTLQPASLAALSRALAECHAAKRAVAAVDLAALASVREYASEDMTVTAEGGLTLAALQATLATRGQWLPIDPPHPERITIRQLLAENLFGPRRCGFGTVREHLIGLEAVLADGRITHSGGKVVKNVAGYDVLKLFVGARDSLGIISAATFKLRPLPEQELFVSATFPSLAAAWTTVVAVLDSPVTPVVLDLHNLAGDGSVADIFTVRIGFAGTRAEVAWQQAQTLVFQPLTPPADAEAAFWANAAPTHTDSVLPTKLPDALTALGRVPFVARAANG